MNSSNVWTDRPLSEVLLSAAKHGGEGDREFLNACAVRARTVEQDVKDFHTAFNHPAPEYVEDMPSMSMLEFRKRLIKEECQELCEAIDEGNLSKIAAEAVDLIYVVVGTLVSLGLPLMPFWRDVQRANMTKVINPDGGKPLKPEGWVAPNPARVLYELKSRK